MKTTFKCPICNVVTQYYCDNGNYCPNCFSVFAQTIPSDEELNDYYKTFNEEYYGGGRLKGANCRQLLYANKYLKIVNRFCKPNSSLIDIGSSNNPFPNIAQDKGYQVTVVDYVKPKELNSNIKFIQSSIENINFDNLDQFEIVTAFAIIEHTKDPLLAIHNLVKITKNMGIIIIYVPEIGEFSDKYALGTSNWFCPPMHLNLLSKKALKHILEENNCKLIFSNKFELSLLRYCIRYSIGYIEGCVGYLFKILFGLDAWLKIRQKRKSKYQGMRYFVFKKVIG